MSFSVPNIASVKPRMTSYLNEQDCQSRNYNGPVTILKHSIGKIHVSFLKKVSEVVLAAIVYIFQCGEE